MDNFLDGLFMGMAGLAVISLAVLFLVAFFMMPLAIFAGVTGVFLVYALGRLIIVLEKKYRDWSRK